MLLCVPFCENNALFALLASLCGILQNDYSYCFYVLCCASERTIAEKDSMNIDPLI